MLFAVSNTLCVERFASIPISIIDIIWPLTIQGMDDENYKQVQKVLTKKDDTYMSILNFKPALWEAEVLRTLEDNLVAKKTAIPIIP